MKNLYRLLAAGIPMGLSVWAGEKLTYPQLVERLTDMQHLATLPRPGEKMAQWSSYDRASRYDAAKHKYIGWDANGDGNGFIRKEGDKFVMAEMTGPGCIWRIWSAAPDKGHVRIYLDGAPEPAVDLPFKGYFDGQNAPFNRSALVHTVATGWNNYVPIPYQHSCKIVADAGWGAYYHFGYATFPKGTQVPTFTRDLGATELAALDRANDLLSRRGSAPTPAPLEALTVKQSARAPAGGTVALGQIKGPRAITALRVRVELPPAPADRDALRALALRITWDGEPKPSVWAPLGDFFGTAPGANAYRSLPMGLESNGWWYAYWYMPFAKSALVEILNDGAEARSVELEVTHAKLPHPIGRYGRFHAKWHRDALLPLEPERQIDWTMLKTTGSGRFCGVMLHIWNPRGGWWGEGDEKFFVDGEEFPSTFGTGSEDYFGYAWSNPTLFQHAYHNQTIAMGNKGHISVNRWHISDQVPFQKSFEGDIEKYFLNRRPTLYACTAYWYLSADGVDPYEAQPMSERVGYWTEVTNVVTHLRGVLEGERLNVLKQTGGTAREQTLEAFEGQWSGDAHLWWTDAKPGDTLDLALPVAKAGRFKLSMQFTKAPDYGIVQLHLDGQKLGDPMDLYGSSVKPTGAVDFGVREFTAGVHKLTVEITGTNPAAIKAYMFGLDYVRLEPSSP